MTPLPTDTIAGLTIAVVCSVLAALLMLYENRHRRQDDDDTDR